MKRLRTALLGVAASLLLVGALGNALVIVPDLRGDLIEIGVRRTVLVPTLFALYGHAMTGFAFVAIVIAAVAQSARDRALPVVALAAVAVVTAAEGALNFSQTHSPHHFAPIVMGLLIAGALLVPPTSR